jgi:hypothetical protein
MCVAANRRGRSPPVAVREKATIRANLRGEDTVHHEPCELQRLLGSTVQSICNN